MEFPPRKRIGKVRKYQGLRSGTNKKRGQRVMRTGNTYKSVRALQVTGITDEILKGKVKVLLQENSHYRIKIQKNYRVNNI